jgi:Carboxypeptidase regulatory-like domain
MQISKVRLALLVAALALAVMPAFGQVTSGNITGSVFDQTGATVPNASIVARNQATDQETSTNSTSAGDYRFENLPVGKYTLTVNAAGFAKAEVKDVDIELNVTVTTNFNLKIGQATTSVQVSEAAVAIDTTTAQIQTAYETKEIADLPVTATGSGVLNLALLSPGVSTSGAVGAGTGPSVGGQRPRNNNFTIEGIDNNDGAVTGPVVSIPNDAVAEFSSLQNQYSPDFGHSSGGQFNTIVKSGTNAFHGELYEYFQNRNLNASDTLSAVDGTPLHPRFDNNRFGGNFGGPIIKNKLFFFVDYEYNPVGEAGSAGLVYAPTAAGYATIAANPAVNQTNLGILQKYLGTASTPVSAAAVGGYPLLGTAAQGPQYLLPAPSGTPIEIGQLSIATPNYLNSETGLGSVDWNISDKDSLRGRFVLNRTGAIDTGAQLPEFYTTVPTNAYLATISEYHNFSPTVINELRLGYNRFSSIDPVGNQTFPGLDQFPNLVFGDLGGVQLGPDPNFPQYGYQNTYQVTDNVTWSHGAHSFKFGFDGIHLVNPQSFTQRSRGDYEYSYLSDYLLDYTPDAIAQRSAGDPVYWGNRYLLGWYGNDTWKIRPNFTVNLGLRYEYQTVPAGEQEQSLNSIASVPGLITFGAPTAQTNAFMPRIGIAYSPGTSGKTSIRAGFGINYDVLFDNLGLLTLPPELSTTQDVTGNGGSNFLRDGGLPPTGPSSTFTAAEARADTAGFVPNQQRPKSYQWNIGIQHEFATNYVFESRYLGTRGTDLDIQDQLDRQPTVTAANALPVFWSTPSAATLNGLTNNLGALNAAYSAGGDAVPAYASNGFLSPITSYQPYGNSVYHGWANQLTRRFSNGLQFIGSYTWSHAIDDSTADVFSTVTTPRRPEDSQDLRLDRSSSALDHRNRLSFEMLYDVPFFKNRNWFMKNVVGNWEIAPIYTYQTGTYWTVQSHEDANLNGDAWPDRAIVNPNGGDAGVGSSVTAVCSGPTAPACPATGASAVTVGYVVDNPNARYAEAPRGTLPNAGRNTAMFNPIDDVDITAAKRFNFTEKTSLEFSARAFNVFNHPQYVGGNISDVGPVGFTGGNNVLAAEPQNSLFYQLNQVYSSNPRSMVLALKFIF